MADSPEVLVAATFPFNKANSDVVLRTCDNVDLRVRKAILSEASVVFEDMWTLPQPPAQTGPDDGVPVVSVSENERTLHYLLRFCYPMENPNLKTVEDVFAVMEAARKYMMDHVLIEVKRQFLHYAEREPLRTYAIACNRGLEEEMRIAAKASLLEPLADSHEMEELERITAGAYLRLSAYHRACRKVASSLGYCGRDKTGRRVWAAKKDWRDSLVNIEPWWASYMILASEALKIRPRGTTVLKEEFVHKFLVDVIGPRDSQYEKNKALSEFAEFSAEFAEAVERIISSIQLKIPLKITL
ncbi:hypothetical protein PHLCEN_2v3216 [Hermanssonia centrifuga]|uniref:BTB domain-containing protein n=1 Tax=Hermanssonia centrifuga TaxID=98765 RepID=A0A2R6QXP9_9APHY|nr:hypothetical protein PHLCEN_2v3216 [Hermanssonia centrifuga]